MPVSYLYDHISPLTPPISSPPTTENYICIKTVSTVVCYRWKSSYLTNPRLVVFTRASEKIASEKLCIWCETLIKYEPRYLQKTFNFMQMYYIHISVLMISLSLMQIQMSCEQCSLFNYNHEANIQYCINVVFSINSGAENWECIWTFLWKANPLYLVRMSQKCCHSLAG